jgi:predicted porin
MKKSLLAIAAMTAFVGAAQAQSSVTVYGILDVGYINQKSDGSGTVANTKANNSLIGTSAETTSRIGFRGTEDLGGGSSAFFTIETNMMPNAATASTWQNRQSFAGLKNKMGEVALGTQYTPVFNQMAATDVGQTNNMIGSVVYPQNAASSNSNPGLAAPYAAASGGGTASDSLTVRTSNTITAKSAKFSGFGAGVMYTQNASASDPATAVETKNNYTGWGVQADFSGVKNLYVGLAYQALKSDNTSPTSSLTSPTPAVWSVAGGGTNTQDNQTYAGATYDFGILKAYAAYVNRKATSTYNTAYFAKRTAQQIGVRSYITPTIEGWASWGNGKLTAYGNSSPSANFTGWQLGANYYLSKRTNLYGIYGANNLASSSASSNVPVNSAAMAVGVRHTF